MEKNYLPEEKIFNSIVVVRNQKVMLDADLAKLYGVETKALKQAVKRNIDRFPPDFMSQLNKEEWKNVEKWKLENLRSQNVTLKTLRGKHSKYPPFAFTEQGVAMLSSVLNSKRAISVNIAIMRVFVKIRQFAQNYSELLKKIDELQKTDKEQNKHIANIYKIIEELVKPEVKKKKRIGF